MDKKLLVQPADTCSQPAEKIFVINPKVFPVTADK